MLLIKPSANNKPTANNNSILRLHQTSNTLEDLN